MRVRNGRGVAVTGLLLLAVFILAVVTVPVAWLLSYVHDLHGKVTRMRVEIADTKAVVSDLVHLLTVEDRS